MKKSELIEKIETMLKESEYLSNVLQSPFIPNETEEDARLRISKERIRLDCYSYFLAALRSLND
jgi:hypothetical protein